MLATTKTIRNMERVCTLGQVAMSTRASTGKMKGMARGAWSG